MIIPLVDTGHIPSGTAVTIVHEATFNVADPAERFSFDNSAEKTWEHTVWSSIVPGSHQSLGVPVPLLEEAKVNSGLQSIIVAGTITYNDGFAGTQDQVWRFCFRNVFQTTMKKSYLIECNTDDFLPGLEKADRYPNNEHKE
jgi:hypothetical protein